MKKRFWGTIKQYSKCYNIICHFKVHLLHVCQIILSYFISVHMKYQVVLLTSGIFSSCIVTRYTLWIEQRFLNNKFLPGVTGTSFAWYRRKWIYLTEHIFLSYFFWFWKIKSFLLPSIFSSLRARGDLSSFLILFFSLWARGALYHLEVYIKRLLLTCGYTHFI